MIDAAQPVVLTRKDFASGQAARWCPGCGDYGVLNALYRSLAKLQIEPWKRVLIIGLCVLGLALALPNAYYSRVEAHNDAVAAIEAGASGQGLEEQAAQWPNWMPSALVNLGLDLRGGAHLLAEVQVEDVHAERMEALWPELRDALIRESPATGTRLSARGAKTAARGSGLRKREANVG